MSCRKLFTLVIFSRYFALSLFLSTQINILMNLGVSLDVSVLHTEIYLFVKRNIYLIVCLFVFYAFASILQGNTIFLWHYFEQFKRVNPPPTPRIKYLALSFLLISSTDRYNDLFRKLLHCEHRLSTCKQTSTHAHKQIDR